MNPGAHHSYDGEPDILRNRSTGFTQLSRTPEGRVPLHPRIRNYRPGLTSDYSDLKPSNSTLPVSPLTTIVPVHPTTTLTLPSPFPPATIRPLNDTVHFHRTPEETRRTGDPKFRGRRKEESRPTERTVVNQINDPSPYSVYVEGKLNECNLVDE